MKIMDMNVPEWEAWVASRPPIVQELARRLPPDRLYRMKSSGHRVTLTRYSENGTVWVAVRAEYNALAFEREVFGISPDDLEECDIPGDDEPRGAMLTERDEINAYCEMVRHLEGIG